MIGHGTSVSWVLTGDFRGLVSPKVEIEAFGFSWTDWGQEVGGGVCAVCLGLMENEMPTPPQASREGCV